MRVEGVASWHWWRQRPPPLCCAVLPVVRRASDPSPARTRRRHEDLRAVSDLAHSRGAQPSHVALPAAQQTRPWVALPVLAWIAAVSGLARSRGAQPSHVALPAAQQTGPWVALQVALAVLAALAAPEVLAQRAALAQLAALAALAQLAALAALVQLAAVAAVAALVQRVQAAAVQAPVGRVAAPVPAVLAVLAVGVALGGLRHIGHVVSRIGQVEEVFAWQDGVVGGALKVVLQLQVAVVAAVVDPSQMMAEEVVAARAQLMGAEEEVEEMGCQNLPAGVAAGVEPCHLLKEMPAG